MSEKDSSTEIRARYDQSTGYITNIDLIREQEYPLLKDTTYLDHAGTTPYPRSLIEEFSTAMTGNLFGNPHSASTSSQLSSRRIDDCRLRVLHLFKASPQDFDVIFVANATAGIKLIADAFRDHEEGFWYGYHAEAHTSLIGVRELALKGSECFLHNQDVEAWIATTGSTSHERDLPRLLAYPAQSNMTGRRLPLSWCRSIRDINTKSIGSTYTLLDAAGLVSTSPLDLSDPSAAPDFTVLSFYKMFGFPDLGALIVRKASSEPLKKRKYFGGGTVNMTISIGEQWHDKRDSSLHSRLEDGTLPFHNIAALECALNVHARLFVSMEAVSRHTAFLQSRMFSGLSSLRHFNGSKVCEMYGEHWLNAGSEASHGATIAFNLRNAYGSYVAKTEVEKLASAKNIQFRTGGLCNPGGVALHLQLTPSDMKKHFAAGQRCGDDNDIIDGRPTGVIRISLGVSSSLRDVDTFLDFIEEFYVDRHPKVTHGLLPPTPPPTPCPPDFYVESLSVFPIKSCGAFEVPSLVRWEVSAEGLAWDREWCLVHQGTGAALSQKRFPRMTLIKPELDFQKQVLRVAYRSPDRYPKAIEISLSRKTEKACSTTDLSRCLSSTSNVCGDNMTVQVYSSPYIADFFSDILEVPCTLARRSTTSSRPPKLRLTQKAPSPFIPGTFPSSPPSSSSSAPPQRLHFSNESPILLVSRSSVDKLNDAILVNATASEPQSSSPPPPPKTQPSVFRGNIVIASSPSASLSTTSASPSLANLTTAFAEESWKSISISPPPSPSAQAQAPTPAPAPASSPTTNSAALSFSVLGPCHRCQMVCIDQATGERSRNAEPFATLAKMRRRRHRRRQDVEEGKSKAEEGGGGENGDGRGTGRVKIEKEEEVEREEREEREKEQDEGK